MLLGVAAAAVAALAEWARAARRLRPAITVAAVVVLSCLWVGSQAWWIQAGLLRAVYGPEFLL